MHIITADEVILAGGGGNDASNSTYYLSTGDENWSLSPTLIRDDGANMFATDVMYNTSNVGTNYGLRPVISLRFGIVFHYGGNGTASNPYIVYIPL